MTISNVPDVSEPSMINANIDNFESSNDFSADIRSLFGLSHTSSTEPVFPYTDRSQVQTSTSLPLDFRTTLPLENHESNTSSCPEYTNNDMYDLLMNNILGSVASFRCDPGGTVENSRSTSDPLNNNNSVQWNLDLG